MTPRAANPAPPRTGAARAVRAVLQYSRASLITHRATYRRASRPAGESGASVMTRRAGTLRRPGRERGERCERYYKTVGRA